jgi:hypothetical protein
MFINGLYCDDIFQHESVVRLYVIIYFLYGGGNNIVWYRGVSGGDGHHELHTEKGTSRTFICLPAHQNGVYSSKGIYDSRQ